MTSGAIYWLASYPKSGNTWMRILLTNYFRTGDEPANINELDGGPIASARAVFDENVGIEASDLTQDEIERLRPAVYEQISDSILAERADRSPGADGAVDMPPVFKVHDAFTTTIDGVALFSKRATAGAIYLVRDPIDVVPSFAHHMGIPIDKAITWMGAADRSFVSQPHRLHQQLRQRVLSWSGHVRSWADEPDLPRIVVRYEDLRANTHAVLGDVIEFLGFEPDEGAVGRAVEHSTFERLQTQERDSSFRERPADVPTFFRKGVVGDGHQTLTSGQLAQVREDHGAVMARFGYLDSP